MATGEQVARAALAHIGATPYPLAPAGISVITPTWQRHERLLERCCPSVLAQTWPAIEHVIVSDGPDEYLADLLPQDRRQRYDELAEHDPMTHWGTAARLRGLELAQGDLIAYVDDDDALLPQHCSLLAEVLEAHPALGFAYSMMRSHGPSGEAIIGCDPPAFGNIGTPMIMHRRSVTGAMSWGAPSAGEDWDLVQAWIAAGLRYAFVPEVTVDVWPSQFGG